MARRITGGSEMAQMMLVMMQQDKQDRREDEKMRMQQMLMESKAEQDRMNSLIGLIDSTEDAGEKKRLTGLLYGMMGISAPPTEKEAKAIRDDLGGDVPLSKVQKEKGLLGSIGELAKRGAGFFGGEDVERGVRSFAGQGLGGARKLMPFYGTSQAVVDWGERMLAREQADDPDAAPYYTGERGVELPPRQQRPDEIPIELLPPSGEPTPMSEEEKAFWAARHAAAQ